jgi:hypothetical protein
MQQDVQIALVQKLQGDAPLVAMLKSGINGFYAEGDAKPTTPVPFIVMEFAGSRVLADTHTAYRQTWIIRAYDQGSGYFRIESILKKVFRILNDSTIVLPSTAETFALQKGVRFMGMTKRNYNDTFKMEFEGAIFDVFEFDKLSHV